MAATLVSDPLHFQCNITNMFPSFPNLNKHALKMFNNVALCLQTTERMEQQSRKNGKSELQTVTEEWGMEAGFYVL